MQSLTSFQSYSRIIRGPKPILVWVNWAAYEKECKWRDPTGIKHGIKLPSWRHMINELIAAGYTPMKVAEMTGISQRTVQRWFYGRAELTHHKLFSQVLYLYCHHQKELLSTRREYAGTVN